MPVRVTHQVVGYLRRRLSGEVIDFVELDSRDSLLTLLMQLKIRPDAYERVRIRGRLKAEEHRRAVLTAATSGNPRFFLGTDSAPHGRLAKEAACGCAGVFSAHAGVELYAEAFESVAALERLEAFTSFYGPDFYGLPRNATTITLTREPWRVPEHYPFGTDELVPLRAGESIPWRLASAPGTARP